LNSVRQQIARSTQCTLEIAFAEQFLLLKTRRFSVFFPRQDHVPHTSLELQSAATDKSLLFAALFLLLAGVYAITLFSYILY